MNDLDFNLETEYVKVDVCGLVQKMKSKKRKMFKICREIKQLEALISYPPKKNECFKMLSVGGGFSSIAIIKFIAEREMIEHLYVSTFRIGHKQFSVLNNLHKQGKLKNADFITSTTQKNTDRDYNYYEFIKNECDSNGWRLKVFNNHSKLILMKTKDNFYVVETSSNLNENPKMEQFSFENDKSLFEWYKELFEELLK